MLRCGLIVGLILLFAHCSLGQKPVERGPRPRLSAETSVECKSRCLSGDCQSGTGTYEFADCSVYQGQFRSGERTGQGEYRFPSGITLKGSFVDGQPVATFEYSFPAGAVFLGSLPPDRQEKKRGILNLDGASGTLIENGKKRRCRVQNFQLMCDSESLEIAAEAPKADVPVGVEPEEIRFLLLYAPDSALLLRNGRKYSVSAGYPLAPGDIILTQQHAADIQGEGGFAIRLKPFSELQIPVDAREHRVLNLKKGSVIVDYKGEGPLPFRIRSGGMNIDVRGTTFVVEAGDEENRVKVRVLEGEVRLSRDQAVLERIKPEDLQNKNLQEAIDRMKEGVSLTAGQEATAPAITSQESKEIAKTIAESGQPRVTKADDNDLEKDAREAALMPVLPDEDFEEARQASLSKDAEDREESAQNVEKQYREKVQSSGDDLEMALKSSPEIRTPEDFKRAYPILEVIHMNKGSRRAGAIIAQAGGLLFLFAPDGLFRVPIEDVDYVDYYNQDEMDLELLRNQNKGEAAPAPESGPN